MSEKTDVLVIGGGVIGVCSAYYLQRAGREVTLVEAGEVCAGCSYGNAGLVVPSHSVPLAEPGAVMKGLKWMFKPDSPFYIKPRLSWDLLAWLWRFWRASSLQRMEKAVPVLRDMGLASRSLFDQFDAEHDFEFHYHTRGMMLIFRTEKDLLGGKEEAEFLGRHGVESRVVVGDEFRELLAGLSTPAAGGVHYTQDAHMDPAAFVRGLAKVCEGRGVEIRENTEVIGFEADGIEIDAVKTTRGEFRARDVVLAGGAWTPLVARDLGLKLPMQPAKGYHITVKRPQKCPDVPAILNEAKVCLTPMGDRLRFAGTLELAGMDFSINRRRVDAILRAVNEYLPDLETTEVIEIWRGLRPCTPDGLPYLGRTKRFTNLTVAAGHAMIGLSLGPITGKLVSQIVCGEDPEIDLALLRPERYG